MVAIPSSSGQSFQRECCTQMIFSMGWSQSLLHQVNRSNTCHQASHRSRLRRNPFFIRSIVPTNRGSTSPWTASCRNPFFIRSIVPTSVSLWFHEDINGSQSLLHQVNRSNEPRRYNTAVIRICRNPFFIRSIVPTGPLRGVHRNIFPSQSLLHQVNRSNLGDVVHE